MVPDQRVVEQFAAAVADPTFHDRVRPRGLDRAAHDPDPRGCEHRGEGGGELEVPIAKQELDRLGALVEIHEQVPDLLGDPGVVRMGGHAEDPDAAGGVLDDC